MKIRKTEPHERGTLLFYCLGCNQYHQVNDGWKFNGDFDNPTLSPSIKVTGTVPITDEEYERIMKGEKVTPKPFICHSFIENGQIRFLNDSTHELAGKIIELPDLGIE